MGLFGWFRSKRQRSRPPALPVRYGLGPPPPAKPKTPELCPLCGGEIIDVRCVGHWSEYDGPGGTWWRARCSTCDTVLARTFGRGISPAWRAPIPAPEQLLAAVSSEELEALTVRFRQVPGFDWHWPEFLAARRSGDEVWRFAPADGTEGYVVVRQGRPLAQFLSPSPALERALLEQARRG